MRFIETTIAGAFLIEPEPSEDERGFFARVFDAAEFERRGLESSFPQWSISYNARRGTLRGLHYQIAPNKEVKLVRCTRGGVFDVIADLDARRWFAVELSESNRKSLYVPRGVAHGFQTLEDGCEVAYAIAGAYDPASARGVRWDDPLLAIEWPAAAERIMSANDRALPYLR